MICSSVNRFFLPPSYHGQTLQKSGAVLGAQVKPTRSIAEVGRLAGVNQNQLSRWIREYLDSAAREYQSG